MDSKTPSAPDMTIQDVADYLNTTNKTVYNMVADGRLRAYRLGPRIVRFRRSDIDAALEQAGYSAAAFVLTPADWEQVELSLSSVNAVEHLALPYDPAARRLFGVPIATSIAQTAGVGHLLATGAVALDTDNRGVDVQWSENATADSFGKNLVFARCESRYATSVFSPLGVVSLDLTP
jgi:excisionase family DNA binding protein